MNLGTYWRSLKYNDFSSSCFRKFITVSSFEIPIKGRASLIMTLSPVILLESLGQYEEAHSSWMKQSILRVNSW